MFSVYYTDGSVIKGNESGPFEIERRADVQVITQPDNDHRWVTLSGYDYYIWDDRGGGHQWFGVDLFGLHHYLLQPGEKCVLFGVMIDRGRFREIFDKARAEMGEKTGYTVTERRPDG